jgi:hypothetical protein
MVVFGTVTPLGIELIGVMLAPSRSWRFAPQCRAALSRPRPLVLPRAWRYHRGLARHGDIVLAVVGK